MSSIFVCLLCISAIVTIPLGPIPFTLQTFAFTFCTFVLEPKWVAISTFLYLLIGILGLPVFSSMRGGIAVVLGPTGGFLWSYVFFSPIISLLNQHVVKKCKNKKIVFTLKLLLGILLTLIAYIFGDLQYSLISGISPLQAVVLTIFPFIIPDLIKIIIAILISNSIIDRIDI